MMKRKKIVVKKDIYEHDDSKLSIRDFIEELEQDDECITKNNILFRICVDSDIDNGVGYYIEIKDLNTNNMSVSKKFKTKKKLINWIKVSQLLLERKLKNIIKKSNDYLGG